MSDPPVVWVSAKLPRAFGWLGRLLPTVERTVFLPLLNDPEMQAIFERAPQVGRILRPWCRVFELEMPEWLRLPKRIRKKKPPLPPDPRAARFPDTPPARAAERALARELAGLPVNVDNLSAEARGYYLHPPRDDNCPPPKIGYAGRRRPLPKDYVPPKDWE